MPIARFQMDDGRIARFEVPDGTTPEQAQAMMEEHFNPPIEAKPLPPIGQQAALIPGQGTNEPTPQPQPYVEPSFTEKARAGVEAAGGVVAGAIGSIPASIYGLGRDIYERTLGEGQAGVSQGGKYMQQAMEKMPLMPKTELGQEYLRNIGEKAALLPPIIPELNVLANRPKSIGKVKEVASPEKLQKQKVFLEGREYGYKATPTAVVEAQPGKAIETIARKQKVEAVTSINNAEARAMDIRKDFGLGEGKEISLAELETVREKLGDSKKAILSEVPVLKTDESFSALAKSLAEKYPHIKEEFPDIAVGGTVNTSQAMELVRYLRKKADEKFSTQAGKQVSPEASLEATRAITNADKIESMIEAQLAKEGKADLLNEYKKQRTLTAQTYAVQKALNPATGEVIGSQLAAQYKKNPELFTGSLKRAAEHATAFPLNNKEITRVQGIQSVNPMQAAFAVSALATGHPFVAAGEIGLSAIPAKMLTSNWMQSKILKINPILNAKANEMYKNATVKMDMPTKESYLQAAAKAEEVAKLRQLEANNAVLEAAGKGRAAIQEAESLAKKNAADLRKATEARLLLEAGEQRGKNMMISAEARSLARKASQEIEAQALADAGMARGINMKKMIESQKSQKPKEKTYPSLGLGSNIGIIKNSEPKKIIKPNNPLVNNPYGVNK